MGSWCGSGSGTTEAAALPVPETASSLAGSSGGQAVWSQGQKVGEEGFSQQPQPPSPPKVKGVRNRDRGTALGASRWAWKMSSQRPWNRKMGKGTKDLPQAGHHGPQGQVWAALSSQEGSPSPHPTPRCAVLFSSPSPHCSPRTGPHSVSPCPVTHRHPFPLARCGWRRWEGGREGCPGPIPAPSWSLNRKFVLKGGHECSKPVLGAEGRHRSMR